ncbi:leucine-rich repeat protein [Candidatus Formimonas warabiya]|uniref:leucine-rich repeat protein n=1 Tax=Formimonas warabiya TaxID=1761012 RepID=UPI001BE42011|nr:leucine-rich repeat protein [Candidatus Formimonas warabiya]
MNRPFSSLLSVLLFLALILTLVPAAGQTAGETGTTGIWKWKVLDDGTLSITGCTAPSGDLTLPDSFMIGSSPVPVTRIENNAFKPSNPIFFPSAIKTFAMPDTVTSVGDSAFSGCSKLTSVTLSQNLRNIEASAFYNCGSLTEVIIPDSVESIGSAAFSNCGSLVSVTLPKNAAFTAIPEKLFSGDGKLKTTNMASLTHLESIGSQAFFDSGIESMTIPNSVTSIGDRAFEACRALESVTLPENAAFTAIPDHLFGECEALQSLMIPESVTSIGADALNGCYALAAITVDEDNTVFSSKDGVLYNADKTTLVCHPAGRSGGLDIPDSVTEIGDYAFLDSAHLTDVMIPDGVRIIGEGAFFNCINTVFEEPVIPDSVTSIGAYAFESCCRLGEITIPEGIAAIGAYTFYGCTDLSEIALPESLTSIGEGAFMACDGLGDVTIPEEVTSLGANAFSFCTGLGDVIIPAKVTSIGANAFWFCTGLRKAVILGSGTSFGSDVFKDTALSVSGIYGFAGSTAQTFASANSFTFHLLYTVSFDSGSGSVVDDVYAAEGEKIAEPTDPTRSDYNFGGWYKDAAYTDDWDFGNDTVSGDMTLHARWVPVPSSATIDPTTGSFDKNPANQANVQTTITWNDAGSVTDVKAGANSIGAGNYSVSGVSGNTLSINKGYLATQSTGILVLTVEFDAGDAATLTIEISDTTPEPVDSATIDPTTGSFDKNPANQANVQTTITWNDAGSVTDVKAGANSIGLGNYSVSVNTLSIEKGYLATQSTDSLVLTVEFDIGDPATLTVAIRDTTPPSISPSERNFDLSSPADMDTVITWNSAQSVTEVVYGSDTLTTPGDYTVTGSALTIKADYLSAQGFSEGDAAEFEIGFDTGDTAVLTVYVVNSYVPSSNADLSDLTVDGSTVSGFDPDVTSYEVELPYGTQPGSAAATVSATADPYATVDITQAVTLPGSATVEVTAEDNITTKTYTIDFTLEAAPNIPVTGITVAGTGGATSVEVGDTLQMLVTIVPNNATNQDVAWSIANGSGADISVSGVLEANAAGAVTVRATAQDGSGVYGEKEITITSSAPGTHSITVQNDGNGTGSANPASAAQGTTIALNAAANSGYHFKEWQVISPASLTITGNTFTMPDEAVTVRAIFEADAVTNYTVTFTSSGSVYATKTVQAGASIGTADWPTDPARSGYSFGGWYTGENGTGSAFTSATAVTATITVYAKWTANSSGPSGGGGGSSTPSAQNAHAEVSVDGTTSITVPVNIDAGSNSAAVNLGGEQGDPIAGGGALSITIPAIPDVNSYTLGIPADYLSSTGGEGTLTFHTDAGSMTLPSNMLTGVSGAGGNKAEITISEGDKSGLPDDVKAAVGDRPLIQLAVIIDGNQTEWNNPDAPVMVSIPYTPTAAELANPESIVVWYITGSGDPVSVPNGHYDPVTGTVTFTTTHFSYYAVGYNKVGFNDVAATAWYHKAVGFIAARGITGGTGSSNYNPDAKLKRGDFLVLLMKSYDIAPDANPAENFSDAGDTYYTGYLAAAKRLGISGGVGNNRYVPEREISRQEMFTLLYNALKVINQLPQGDSGKPLSGFSDAGQIESWAMDAMTLLVGTGAIGGNAGKLTPTSTTTRAEMAQVLYNLLLKK